MASAPLRRPRVALAATAAALALGLAGATPTVLATHPEPEFGPHGINDERGFYHAQLGLFSEQCNPPRPAELSEQLRANGRSEPLVLVSDAAGIWGVRGGPLVHFVDGWLCDPLLARLPVADPGDWKIGHFTRRIPEGYLETLASGRNRILHPGLARFYDTLRTVVRDDVLAGHRLRAVWNLHFGAVRRGLDEFVATDYRDPPTRVVESGSFAEPAPEGTPWHAERVHVVYDGGVEVRFGEVQLHDSLIASLDGADTYRFEFRRRGELVAEHELETTRLPMIGLGDVPLRVPLQAARRGFDAVRVLPVRSKDRIWAIGGLRLPAR